MIKQYEKVEDLWNCMGHFDTEKKVDEVYLGIDVGTANVVTVVVDKNGNPITGEITPARVVREGIIMDYLGAVRIVQDHVNKITKRLGVPLVHAVSAIPPLTEEGNKKVTKNVLEGAGLNVVDIIDEPTAAAITLNLKDGIVVDIGGGSTGISILRDGKVSYTADEPTGGFQLDLVLAGNLGIDTDEAEKMKRDESKQEELFHIVQPVFEKLAYITNQHSEKTDIETVYLVGGTSSFSGFDMLMEKECKRKMIVPEHALLVTPLGMALYCAQVLAQVKI